MHDRLFYVHLPKATDGVPNPSKPRIREITYPYLLKYFKSSEAVEEVLNSPTPFPQSYYADRFYTDSRKKAEEVLKAFKSKLKDGDEE